jgi:hypothetical protein
MVGVPIAAIAFTFFAFQFNRTAWGWSTWYALSTRGRHTEGRILRTTPENHSTCHFEYTVELGRFEGSDGGCRRNAGDIVSITYLPENPRVGTSTVAGRTLRRLVLPTVIVSLLTGVIATRRLGARPAPDRAPWRTTSARTPGRAGT